MPHPPLKTFIIYARADTEYKKVLRRHLTPLERQGLLDVWDDAHLLPGEEWKKSIEDRLDESDLVLMLVSAASLFSDFIQNKELKRTLERKKLGATQFIPILVQDCLWDVLPDLKDVQMLPLDAQRNLLAVAAWHSPDSAWAAALRELLKLIPEIQQKIAKEKEAFESARRAEQETTEQREAVAKIEKQRFRRDEAAWKKVQIEVMATTILEAQIEIYKTYLEDDVIHRNHRVEAEEAIQDLEGELFMAHKLAQKEAQKRFEAEANKKKEEAVKDHMVLVKGGRFEMGDVMGDNEFHNEIVHTVILNDFFLGAHPVTFEEFDFFCEATDREKPSDEGWGRSKRPVININWYDAIEYCNWLSEIRGLPHVYDINKTIVDPSNNSRFDNKKWLVIVRPENWQGSGYRLPTEAEWEYASRAVDGTGGCQVRFGNGKDVADPKEINFDGNYKRTYSIMGECRPQTIPVSSFLPNSLGLYDMSGNVWEWCWDWYSNYHPSPQTNPLGPEGGAGRVFRGGSWGCNPVFVRCAYRNYAAHDFCSNGLGFRIARSAP